MKKSYIAAILLGVSAACGFSADVVLHGFNLASAFQFLNGEAAAGAIAAMRYFFSKKEG